MKLCSKTRGMKLVELVFTMAIISVVGLVLFSLLNVSTILGAKNSAVNTAHQQARMAMVAMLQDLHLAISLPYLVDPNGGRVFGAGPAAGIAFQQWSCGPYKFKFDADAGDTVLHIVVPNGQPQPAVGQRFIVPSHQVEADITATGGGPGNFFVTLDNFPVPPGTANSYQISPAIGAQYPWYVHTLPIDINGTASAVGDICCFIADRCSYTVVNGGLQWLGPTKTSHSALATLGGDITNMQPFSTPLTPAGALYSRFVAAINLSTADPIYSNRQFKSANIFLNGQVPLKAQLTTYQ
jgi:type II secretory pathway pseudopilin PulG